jgi:predicted lipoprotein with Yx(FWY)xxD motif
MSKPSLLVPVICALGAAGFVVASTAQADSPPRTTAGKASASSSTAPSKTPGSEAPGSETPGSETPGSESPGSGTPALPTDTPGSSGSSGSGTSAPPTPANPNTVQLTTTQTRIGVVVLGPGGRTLYRFKNDTSNPPKSTCYAGCAIGFPPVLDTGDIKVSGIDPALIGRVRRDDGKYQVTLAGWPLYRFNGENGPHQLLGEGVRGLWHAIGPNGQPAVNQ